VPSIACLIADRLWLGDDKSGVESGLEKLSDTGSRSECRAGLSAAGRSSGDPATARKAEEKKRGEGARMVTQGNTAACNLL